MIISMTGFGKASSEFGGKKITVEIKSLNSKTTDTKVRLPFTYREKELAIRSAISKELNRGKIDFSVSIENVTGNNASKINAALASEYHKQLKELDSELNESTENLLSLVMGMPNVLEQEKAEANKDEWNFISDLVNEAFSEIKSFRTAEGEVLQKDLLLRVESIAENLNKVSKYAPKRVEEKRQKIKAKFEEFQNDSVDQNRFEQELIYYIEKLDITEEEVRLKAHLDYFKSTIDLPESQGKKLGFITQEMGREINTIGSKSNHAEMQQLVVQMKDDLEKIKEQILNVL